MIKKLQARTHALVALNAEITVLKADLAKQDAKLAHLEKLRRRTAAPLIKHAERQGFYSSSYDDIAKFLLEQTES